MSVIVLQVFVSLMLVLGSIVLFLWSAKQKDFEHADRLSLLPMETENTVADVKTITPKEEDKNANGTH